MLSDRKRSGGSFSSDKFWSCRSNLKRQRGWERKKRRRWRGEDEIEIMIELLPSFFFFFFFLFSFLKLIFIYLKIEKSLIHHTHETCLLQAGGPTHQAHETYLSQAGGSFICLKMEKSLMRQAHEIPAHLKMRELEGFSMGMEPSLYYINI